MCFEYTAFRLYAVGPGWTRWAHILLWIGSNPIYGTVYVAQLVRVLDCDSRGREFKSHHTPKYALVMELVVMLVLETSAERFAGSNPARGTITHIVQLDRTLDYESRDRSSNLFEGTYTPIVQLNRTSPF
jgi:hypothetical protein